MTLEFSESRFVAALFDRLASQRSIRDEQNYLPDVLSDGADELWPGFPVH